MGNDYIVNIFNEVVTLLPDDTYDEYESFITEATDWKKKLQDRDIYTFTFKHLNNHQHRPSLVIRMEGIVPLIMLFGSTKDDGKWKLYKENIFLNDWSEEGLVRPSFAYTNAILPYSPEIRVGKYLGTLTEYDYLRIVVPTVKKLRKMMIDDMFKGNSLSSNQAIRNVYKKVNAQEESYTHFVTKPIK